MSFITSINTDALHNQFHHLLSTCCFNIQRICAKMIENWSCNVCVKCCYDMSIQTSSSNIVNTLSRNDMISQAFSNYDTFRLNFMHFSHWNLHLGINYWFSNLQGFRFNHPNYFNALLKTFYFLSLWHLKYLDI